MSTSEAGEVSTNWNKNERMASRRVGVNAFVTRRNRRLARLWLWPKGRLRSLRKLATM